jgi:hypothetical protein
MLYGIIFIFLVYSRSTVVIKKTGRATQVIEHLPSKHKALSSNPSTKKEREKRRREEERVLWRKEEGGRGRRRENREGGRRRILFLRFMLIF